MAAWFVRLSDLIGLRDLIGLPGPSCVPDLIGLRDLIGLPDPSCVPDLIGLPDPSGLLWMERGL